MASVSPRSATPPLTGRAKQAWVTTKSEGTTPLPPQYDSAQPLPLPVHFKTSSLSQQAPPAPPTRVSSIVHAGMYENGFIAKSTPADHRHIRARTQPLNSTSTPQHALPNSPRQVIGHHTSTVLTSEKLRDRFLSAHLDISSPPQRNGVVDRRVPVSHLEPPYYSDLLQLGIRPEAIGSDCDEEETTTKSEVSRDLDNSSVSPGFLYVSPPPPVTALQDNPDETRRFFGASALPVDHRPVSTPPKKHARAASYGLESVSRPSSSNSHKSASQAAAANFFTRAAQKLSMSSSPASATRRKKQRSSHDQRSLDSEPSPFATKFSDLIHTSPPPAPPMLGRGRSYASGKMKVVLRVCEPLSEAASNSSYIVADEANRRQVTLYDPTRGGYIVPSQRTNVSSAPKSFAVDQVFTTDHSLAEVCAFGLADVLAGVVAGSDGCVFSYGYAGSGIGYTMIGSDQSASTLGVIPCAIAWLFRLIADRRDQTGARFSIRVSAVEVAGRDETLRDLLAELATGSELGGGSAPGVYLRDDPIGGSQLANESELRAPSAEKAALYLDAALAARTRGEDHRRDCHMFFTLHVYQYRVEKTDHGPPVVAGGRSRLHLIDLGGCSRARDQASSVTGAGTSLSVSALGNVLLALMNGQRHIPHSTLITCTRNIVGNQSGSVYVCPISGFIFTPPHRNSKVARMLRDALGGVGGAAAASAVMLAHVSSAPAAYADSLNVVQLAARIHRSYTKRRRTAKLSTGGGSSLTTSSDENSSSCGGDASASRRLFARGGIRMGTFREGSSDPEYSESSEQSCDTVIYVGADGRSLSDRELTDGEGPPGSRLVRQSPQLGKRMYGLRGRSRSSGASSGEDSGSERQRTPTRKSPAHAPFTTLAPLIETPVPLEQCQQFPQSAVPHGQSAVSHGQSAVPHGQSAVPQQLTQHNPHTPFHQKLVPETRPRTPPSSTCQPLSVYPQSPAFHPKQPRYMPHPQQHRSMPTTPLMGQPRQLHQSQAQQPQQQQEQWIDGPKSNWTPETWIDGPKSDQPVRAPPPTNSHDNQRRSVSSSRLPVQSGSYSCRAGGYRSSGSDSDRAAAGRVERGVLRPRNRDHLKKQPTDVGRVGDGCESPAAASRVGSSTPATQRKTPVASAKRTRSCRGSSDNDTDDANRDSVPKASLPASLDVSRAAERVNSAMHQLTSRVVGEDGAQTISQPVQSAPLSADATAQTFAPPSRVAQEGDSAKDRPLPMASSSLDATDEQASAVDSVAPIDVNGIDDITQTRKAALSTSAKTAPAPIVPGETTTASAKGTTDSTRPLSEERTITPKPRSVSSDSHMSRSVNSAVDSNLPIIKPQVRDWVLKHSLISQSSEAGSDLSSTGQRKNTTLDRCFAKADEDQYKDMEAQMVRELKLESQAILMSTPHLAELAKDDMSQRSLSLHASPSRSRKSSMRSASADRSAMTASAGSSAIGGGGAVSQRTADWVRSVNENVTTNAAQIPGKIAQLRSIFTASLQQKLLSVQREQEYQERVEADQRGEPDDVIDDVISGEDEDEAAAGFAEPSAAAVTLAVLDESPFTREAVTRMAAASTDRADAPTTGHSMGVLETVKEEDGASSVTSSEMRMTSMLMANRESVYEIRAEDKLEYLGGEVVSSFSSTPNTQSIHSTAELRHAAPKVPSLTNSPVHERKRYAISPAERKSLKPLLPAKDSRLPISSRVSPDRKAASKSRSNSPMHSPMHSPIRGNRGSILQRRPDGASNPSLDQEPSQPDAESCSNIPSNFNTWDARKREPPTKLPTQYATVGHATQSAPSTPLGVRKLPSPAVEAKPAISKPTASITTASTPVSSNLPRLEDRVLSPPVDRRTKQHRSRTSSARVVDSKTMPSPKEVRQAPLEVPASDSRSLRRPPEPASRGNENMINIVRAKYCDDDAAEKVVSFGDACLPGSRTPTNVPPPPVPPRDYRPSAHDSLFAQQEKARSPRTEKSPTKLGLLARLFGKKKQASTPTNSAPVSPPPSAHPMHHPRAAPLPNPYLGAFESRSQPATPVSSPMHVKASKAVYSGSQLPRATSNATPTSTRLSFFRRSGDKSSRTSRGHDSDGGGGGAATRSAGDSDSGVDIGRRSAGCAGVGCNNRMCCPAGPPSSGIATPTPRILSPYSTVTRPRISASTSSGHGSSDNSSVLSGGGGGVRSPAVRPPSIEGRQSSSSGYDSVTAKDSPPQDTGGARRRSLVPKRQAPSAPRSPLTTAASSSTPTHHQRSGLVDAFNQFRYGAHLLSSEQSPPPPVDTAERRRARVSDLLSRQRLLRSELSDTKRRLGVDSAAWSYDLYVAEQAARCHDPHIVEALERETRILQSRVDACKSHIMMVTCFDRTLA